MIVTISCLICHSLWRSINLVDHTVYFCMMLYVPFNVVFSVISLCQLYSWVKPVLSKGYVLCSRTQHSGPDEFRAFCVLFIIVSILYFTCQSFWMSINFIEFCYSMIPFGTWQAWFVLYSKTCVKRPLSKIDKTKIFITNGSLMKGKSNAECSPWSILHYFWPAVSDDWSWKPICGLF